MLSAVATILMFVEFPVFFMPPFIKMDISEMPALIAAFLSGPMWGVAVCLVKNLIKAITFTNTAMVGEAANFLLGITFVLPAGLIYKYNKTRRGALVGALTGAAVMAVISVPINYFVTYPFYMKLMPLEAIVDAYRAIFPGVNGLLECLIVFNVPFNLFKGIICTLITFIIYKRISKYIKG